MACHHGAEAPRSIPTCNLGFPLSSFHVVSAPLLRSHVLLTSPARSSLPCPTAPALLQDGVWPTSLEQSRCLNASARLSDAYTDFATAAILIGSGMLFNSTETAALVASAPVQKLLNTPIFNITSRYAAWAQQAAAECGLPAEYQAPGASNSSQLGAWIAACVL